jgi:Ca2+-binding EF-hand superfamily protein
MKILFPSMCASLLCLFFCHRLDAQDLATGDKPLVMDVAEMDMNHDGMISRDEFAAYGEKIWKAISHGAETVRVEAAGTDFATGNMSMKVLDMDTDHDGTISHAEFMEYGARAFDKVKDARGGLTLRDTESYFASGNRAR